MRQNLTMRLKELKEVSKMTNQELADKSGVPLATVNRILSGATPNPSYETVILILEALNGSLDDLSEAARASVNSEPLTNHERNLYERALARSNKWVLALAIILGIFVLGCVSLLIVDLLIPTIGYFRG